MSTATDSSPKVNEMFQQAAKLFETAVQSGIKIQEEAVRSMGDMMSHLGSPHEWRQRSESAAEKAVDAVQKNLDEATRLMNENAKASLDLLQKAFDASRNESSAESWNRTREMWETAVGSVRRNVEVMLQANNRVVESWREIGKIMRGQG